MPPLTALSGSRSMSSGHGPIYLASGCGPTAPATVIRIVVSNLELPGRSSPPERTRPTFTFSHRASKTTQPGKSFEVDPPPCPSLRHRLGTRPDRAQRPPLLRHSGDCIPAMGQYPTGYHRNPPPIIRRRPPFAAPGPTPSPSKTPSPIF